jgi:hypothetical protein
MSVTLKDVGFGDVPDPEVKKALEDALKAAAVTGGRRGGGKTRKEVLAAAKDVSKDALTEKGNEALKGKVNTAVYAVTGTAAAGAVGMVAVNRPDLLAQLAEVIAVSLSEIVNLGLTSTYSDWGKAILIIGRGIGVISQTGALQAGQGPVVPFAIATAIMTWRAQSQGKTFMQQMKDDVESGKGAVKAAATAVASAAVKAATPDPMEALFELTERARQIKVAGAGAADLRALVKSGLRGEVAVESGAAEGLSAVVPSSRGPPRDPSAPLKAIAALAAPPRMGEVTRRGSEAITAEVRARAAAGEGAVVVPSPVLPPGPKPGDKRKLDDGAGVFPPGAKRPDVGESDTEGGRRRRHMTKKRKSKRRVTRRKAPSMVKFVY